MTLPNEPQTAQISAREPIGCVLSVRGSEAQVSLPLLWPSEEARATVGNFLIIGAGRERITGLITEVAAQGDLGGSRTGGAAATVDLVGRLEHQPHGPDIFHRGVSRYPAIGEPAAVITRAELEAVYRASKGRSISIGHLQHDASIPAYVDVDALVSKHFAVLGSTGVGKSSGVAVLLGEIMAARPDLRIFMLDGHNEYGRCFGARAHVVNARNLKLPFWMFNFDELVDVIYGGHAGVQEEVDILAELIPIAKASYLQNKASTNRLALKKGDPKSVGCTVDTPVPYLLQGLLSLIDDRMGRLESRTTRMHYHRLMARIETLRNDSRYGFMFDNANVGGDTMALLLSQLFRLEGDGKPITVMQLAGLPPEVVDAVVCVLCRLAFDFGLWSDGKIPLLLVCEEAHRYASVDPSTGFAPTRRALARIAKEGRKYGTYLGLVTQRPAELDPTIISQCSTLFAMRMTNDRDQALLRSAVTDAAANLLAFVPSLGTREFIGFGEGVPLPARLTFKQLPAHLLPRSEAIGEQEPDPAARAGFVQAVVDRWRGASIASLARQEDELGVPPQMAQPATQPPAQPSAPPPGPPVLPAALSDDLAAQSLASRLEQLKYQTLRRRP